MLNHEGIRRSGLRLGAPRPTKVGRHYELDNLARVACGLVGTEGGDVVGTDRCMYRPNIYNWAGCKRIYRRARARATHAPGKLNVGVNVRRRILEGVPSPHQQYQK